MNVVDCESERPGEARQVVRVRSHTFNADLGPPDSADSAPGAHDYFDTALAACKTLTATWFASPGFHTPRTCGQSQYATLSPSAERTWIGSLA